MGNGIYLSREGQVFGPITEQQLEEMRASGELSRFSWIWPEGAANWQPIAGPPPAPDRTMVTSIIEMKEEEQIAEEPTRDVPTEATRAYDVPDAPWAELERTSPSMTMGSAPTTGVIQRFGFGPTAKRPGDDPTVVKGEHLARLRVICHSDRALLGGQLTRASARGAVVIGPASRQMTGATFKRGAKVQVNLVDSASGRSETVSAVVEGTVRHDNVWEYRLRWSKAPQLVKAG